MGFSDYLTSTNVLTLVFLVWSYTSLSGLYRILNPALPSLYDGGGLLPLSFPLWAAAPHGLCLSLRLSNQPLHGGGASKAHHVLELFGSSPLLGLQYGWDIIPRYGGAFDMEVAVEVLRSGGEGGSGGKASGLRVVCERDVMGEYSPVCLALARRRAASASASAAVRLQQRDFAREAATVLKKGVLTSLVTGLSSALGLGGGEVDDEFGSGAAPVSLEVLSDTSAPAAALAAALLKGRPVYLHSTISWATAAMVAAAEAGEAASAVPPHAAHRRAAGRKRSTLQSFFATLGGGDGSKEAATDAALAARRAAALGAIAGSPSALAALPEHAKSLTIETPLVESLPYQAPVRRRFLWRPWVAPGSALPALLGVSLEGEAREAAEAADLAAGRLAHVRPGTPSPHFVGQVDLRLIQDTAAFPRDAMPPHAAPYLRTLTLPTPAAHQQQQHSFYLPRMAANPVRPTRDRLLPLNASVSRLPLRLTLAPIAAGAWNLMSLMDASISTQHSMGASAKDTDDVIRLLNDTPSWLLVVIFGVTFLHTLFELLALQSDVSFWAGARSLRGISVRSLGVQAASQVVITAYLAREGSSLLVTVPSAAGVVLALWKISRAGGWTVERRAGCCPWPVHDAALAGSAVEGGAGEFDREAVGAMTALLAPLLVGAAARSLVHDMHAGWVDWALGTAVAAVYGFGFALMTPQLWMNYRLKSVAHLPWNVLGFRFFNTIIDDVFAAFIKMPLCV